MKRAQLLELEGTRDRVADQLFELRRLIEEGHRIEGVSPRNVTDLRECLQLAHSAMASLDIIGERIKRLRCDQLPCDRVDGICPKCERAGHGNG